MIREFLQRPETRPPTVYAQPIFVLDQAVLARPRQKAVRHNPSRMSQVPLVRSNPLPAAALTDKRQKMREARVPFGIQHSIRTQQGTTRQIVEFILHPQKHDAVEELPFHWI